MPRSAPLAVGGASVVGVTVGMARFAYRLTHPQLREDLGLSELVLAMVSPTSRHRAA
jgi:hypothetical protein